MFQIPPAFSVLGLPVHVMDDYPDWLLYALKAGKGTHVVTLNSEMTIQAEKNPTLANIIQNAELVIPDGAGVVLYLQYLLGKKIQRIPGIELAEKLLQTVAQNKYLRQYFSMEAHQE